MGVSPISSDRNADSGEEEEEIHASKQEVKKLRQQLRETRLALNNMASRFTEEIVSLKTLARMAQKSNGVARDRIEEVKRDVTTVLQSYGRRTEGIEERIISLDGWAGDVATRADRASGHVLMGSEAADLSRCCA